MVRRERWRGKEEERMSLKSVMCWVFFQTQGADCTNACLYLWQQGAISAATTTMHCSLFLCKHGTPPHWVMDTVLASSIHSCQQGKRANTSEHSNPSPKHPAWYPSRRNAFQMATSMLLLVLAISFYNTFK